MDIRAKITVTLPKELIDTLEINDETLFSTYFEDGKLIVEPIDETCGADYDEDDEEYCEDEEEGEVPERCLNCPRFCHICQECTLQD